MELQLEILERFLKEAEPLEDEIKAIENEEELIAREKLYDEDLSATINNQRCLHSTWL